MQKQSPGFRAAGNQRQWQTIAALLLLLMAVIGAGCGAPGEPLPPSPPIPEDVSDLAGHQAGDGVLLTFTLPTKSTLGDRLAGIPTFEILRGAAKADARVDEKSFRVVDTIPGAVMAAYAPRGKAEFLDPITPAEIRLHPGETVVYKVRARVTDRKVSADSNTLLLQLYPVPERIEHVDARVAESGIELSWSAPRQTSGGEPLTQVDQYHVYRGEIEADSQDAAAKDIHQIGRAHV